MSAAFLDVREVHKRYGAAPALSGVSFCVARGEAFGLLGPNGAGKTTLLSILSCLRDPDSGETWLAGERLNGGSRGVRRRIGLVPQELAIYDNLTARENLQFFGELYGLRGQRLRDRAHAVLAAIGLIDRADHRAGTFSGGMKRRLNLGAALLHEPAIVLLDEPTTGVDPQSRNHIFEEIRRLNASGVTIVYTSHYMEEVQTLCTRVGIIDHGRLIACDSLSNLLRHLPGLIRFRTPAVSPSLRERLATIPESRWIEGTDGPHQLECQDVKATLIRLAAALTETQTELIALESEEPNLERVFLHLTGHALRD